MMRARLMPADLYGDLGRLLAATLHFERRVLSRKLGGNVRDASCYVCWALFQAAALPAPLVRGLVADLVLLGCFDREVNLRRAASAAVQEAVGRQGLDSAEGVALVQTLDYFSVGNLPACFLEIAPAMVTLGAVPRDQLARHLLTRVLASWDPEVRRLGAQALVRALPGAEDRRHALAALTETAAAAADVDVWHGAALGQAALLAATADVPADLVATLAASAHVVPRHNKGARVDVLEALLALAAELLPHLPNRRLPAAFGDAFVEALGLADARLAPALRSLAAALDPADVDRAAWLDQLTSGRPGYAHALGEVLAADDSDAGAVLVAAVAGAADMAVRVAAMDALARVLARAADPAVAAGPTVHAALTGLADFTIDRVRGDIGSQLRLAAAAAVRGLPRSVVAALDADTVDDLCARLLRVAADKIDRLRTDAAAALDWIVPGLFPAVPAASLATIYAAHFGRLTGLLASGLSERQTAALWLGLASSMSAASSESVVRATRDAVGAYLPTLDPPALTALVDDTIGRMVVDGRIMLKTDSELLELVAFFFDDGSLPNPALDPALYVRVYNKVTKLYSAGTKTASARLLTACVAVYAGLVMAGHSKVAEMALKKLVGLLGSPISPVRQRAADALFLLVADVDSDGALAVVGDIEAADWQGPTYAGSAAAVGPAVLACFGY
ncbi:uncharacterized protein V1510DRAFT_410105 [Dipodascopsis tothii]|uniref:uncharacterized protein n=1 Tax=Dipodascopsis tothii TaxID=44089 RepID=UPI0034CEDB6C